MRHIEQAWTRALGHAGTADPILCDRAAKHIASCKIDMDILRAGAANDGLIVPALVRALKTSADADLRDVIHTGLTSQDVIDTAFVLLAKAVLDLFRVRLVELRSRIGTLSRQFGDRPIMGRTRMQAAVPIRVADRLRAWAAPVDAHLDRLDQLEPRLLRLQFGGPVGMRDGIGAARMAAALAAELNLPDPGAAWHTDRGSIAELAGWLSIVTGSVGKIGQDIALMAQMGPQELTLKSGGTSSAMPHKQNPVRAELLVTLARYNASQLAAMHHSLVHEQERSGAAWALEWMILPDMLMATGCSLVSVKDALDMIAYIGDGPPAP